MGKKAIIGLAVFMVALIAGASVLYGKLAEDLPGDTLVGHEVETGAGEQESVAEKIEAPDFTVFDHYGMQVSLEAFRGKPVVLNFWASWCGPCKNEMPDFEEAYREYGEEVHFLMVNLTDGYRGETREQAKQFVDEAGYHFPVYFDTESSAAIAYGIHSVPQTFFVDAEGYLVARAGGMITYDLLLQGLDLIMK